MRLFILRIAFLLGTVFYTLPAVSGAEGGLSLEDDELHDCSEAAVHHLQSNDIHYNHNDSYDFLADKKEAPSAHALKRGETIGEAMGFVAPLVKYGVPIGAGIGFVFLGLVSGGTAAIPLVFCVPIVAAFGTKLSNMLLRIPTLALDSGTAAAYQQVIQKKGYKEIPTLPFEDWVLKSSRRIKGWFQSVRLR